MSRPDLTKEQAAAAHRGKGDACVMAGAGSGKTTVLTERFTTIVSSGQAEPRRIAALTFTEKAADEMRGRIAEAVRDERENAKVRAAGRDVEFAPISTIHAFCARLLREHAIDAGVDPAFALMDETAATLLLEDAYDAVERRWRIADTEGRQALALLGDEKIGRAIRSLLERLRGDGADPAAARWARGRTDLPTAITALRSARSALAAAITAATDAGGLSLTSAKALADAIAHCPAPESVSAPTFDAARLAAVAGDKDTGGGRLPLPTSKGAAAARAARDALVDAYACVSEAVLDDIGAREIEGPLRHFLADLDREYALRKRAQSTLDFVDLEREALALLERLAARGRPLEGAPTELLIDEYQDTNPLQVKIFSLLRRLTGRGAAVPQFSVGDPKQSIYRFRRADVRGMLDEWESVGPANQTSLTESFRSSHGLVAFHNALFSRLFADGAGGAPYQPMTSRGEFFEHDPAPAEILLIDCGAGAKGDAWGRRTAEARAIAMRVRGWVDGGRVLRAKKEKAPGGGWKERRPLGFGDVAVLLRARSDVKVYERAFLEAGIPFHVGRGRGFYGTEEIADLLHLLRVVHDPKDRFALAAWMTSPAVGATDADVFAFFVGGGEPPAPRIADALQTIARLRQLSAGSSVEALVAEAVDLSAAVPTSLLQDGGARRARNLAKAVAIARRLEGDGVHGLEDYLRRLTDLRDREVNEAEAAAGAGEEKSVALLTIHGAKGLEWPCVILADAGRKSGGYPPSFHVGEGGTFAWRLRDPLEGEGLVSGGYRAIDDAEKALEAEESLRLLYVGLTRAEERLLVTMSAAGSNTTNGMPKEVYGWGKALWEVLGEPVAVSRVEKALPDVHDAGDARVIVSIEAPELSPPDAGVNAPYIRRHDLATILDGPAPSDEGVLSRRAEALWVQARRPVSTLRRTPYVVTISDLLMFAESPQEFYRERLIGSSAVGGAAGVGGGAPTLALKAEPDDPGSGAESDPDSAAREAIRADRWDEYETPGDAPDAVDRKALGRAVHAVLEHIQTSEAVPEDLLKRALSQEFGGAVPAAAAAAARAMVGRFLVSPTGGLVRAALRDGGDVRREVAFHARIKFPDGTEVAGLSALIVKGTIDLWLGGEGGVRILDYKTNSPRSRHKTVEALRDHYAPQLRLYALAAERVLGHDVKGAGLLLLDPEWAQSHPAVEVEVDVSGPTLAETRRLCRAFAVSMLEDRYPARWQDLI